MIPNLAPGVVRVGVTAGLSLATLLVLGLGLAGCLFPVPHWRTIGYDLQSIEALPRND